MSKISVDAITDEAGTGAPDFPNGISATGTVTATTFSGSGASLTGINAFKPVAVTGTAPSLDVGTYNFFNSGTLTGDTTISFASVPTNANWRYKFKPVTLVGAWDVTTASISRSFSVAGQETGTSGVFFKPDGTKMYVTGSTGDDINEYNLSTAWDVTTASVSQLFSVAAQETQPTDVFFKPDGLKMYMCGSTGDDINEYDLSTAWDVSSASYLQLFSLAAQDTSPQSISFKPDGTKMYISGRTGDDINEYDLSTAWDVSSASYLQLFSVAAQELSPGGLFFKPDGLKMYVCGNASDNINEYDLSTAWNVTTASFLQLISIASQDAVSTGIFFKPDGLRLYMAGGNSNVIYEYNLGSPTSVTLPASLQNAPSLALVHDTEVTYEFLTDDAGVTVKLIAEEVI